MDMMVAPFLSNSSIPNPVSMLRIVKTVIAIYFSKHDVNTNQSVNKNVLRPESVAFLDVCTGFVVRNVLLLSH